MTVYKNGVEQPLDIGARVYRTANQTIPDNVWTALAFDNENYDTDGIHDNVTNNSRLTCQTAGKYLIIGHVGWVVHAGGMRRMQIKLNGTTALSVDIFDPAGSEGWHNTSTIYDLGVGDYVELEVRHTTGDVLDIYYSDYTPIFQMQRIG